MQPLLTLLHESKKRRAARGSLTEFAKAAGFEPAAHHRLLIAQLEKLARGEIRKLMVFMPPGSAKSTYSSILFPAWYLAQEGAGNVIAASHSTELAERFGRKVRNLASEFGPILGYGLSADSASAGRWETTTKREYFAAGVGVGIAGFRSKLSLIDDPFRTRQDADSPLIRDRVWDWYNDDLDTRLVPGGGQALVMTRWHEDDLAGRLLARDGRSRRPRNRVGQEVDDKPSAVEVYDGGWEVLSLPAIAGQDDPLGRDPGEWLWEDGYGYASRLREKQLTADTRSWSALYQQEPTPDEGDYFKGDWFRPTNLPPLDTLRVYGASDYAVTAKGGDYTVHIVVGIDQDSRLYVLDLWRKQAASDDWVEAWCDLVCKWRPLGWAEEVGQIKAGVGPFLTKRAREREAYTYRQQFPTRGDKAVRAQSIRGRMAMNGLYIDAAAPWRADLVSECLRFPAGVHDDQVDALGLIGQLLDTMTDGAVPEPDEKRSGPRDWFDDDDDEDQSAWKTA